MSGNSYDLTMMRAKKSSKWLATMVGIALLVVLLGAIPGYAMKPEVQDIPDQTITEGGTQSHGPLGDSQAARPRILRAKVE